MLCAIDHISVWSQKLFFAVFKSRGDLEQQSIETSNTSEAVGFITYVQSLKRKMKNWEKDVEVHFVVYFMIDILCKLLVSLPWSWSSHYDICHCSCTRKASAYWNDSASSSHPTGCTATTLMASGAHSMTSSNERMAQSRPRLQACKWRSFQKTRLLRARHRIFWQNGRKRSPSRCVFQVSISVQR